MNEAEEALFHSLMAGRAPNVAIRREHDGDAEFLTALFIACSPLAGMLPEAMLAQQADIAVRSFGSNYLNAMRQIFLVDGQPVGRLIIDWNTDGGSHCADIALMPHVQGNGLGHCILQCWIDVANRFEKACTLQVMTNNPALRLYERLGFRPTTDIDGTEASLDMKRPAD